jgi:bifunctional enzyme CysN/CysC
VTSLRSDNVYRHAVSVDREARARLVNQRASVVWFTGLSGSGKSTVANLVEVELHARGHLTYMLDGDNVRHGLCGDLGFSDADRQENIRRVAEVAQLMLDAGLIVLASFISPFRADRDRARSGLAPGEFFEVHVDVPLAVAEQRDPKGLYAKARRGELRNFTGIDSPYEAPKAPELHLDMTRLTVPEAAAEVVATLSRAGRLNAT